MSTKLILCGTILSMFPQNSAWGGDRKPYKKQISRILHMPDPADLLKALCVPSFLCSCLFVLVCLFWFISSASAKIPFVMLPDYTSLRRREIRKNTTPASSIRA